MYLGLVKLESLPGMIELHQKNCNINRLSDEQYINVKVFNVGRKIIHKRMITL